MNFTVFDYWRGKDFSSPLKARTFLGPTLPLI